MNIRIFIGATVLCIAASFLACNGGLRPDESIVNVPKAPVDTTSHTKETGFSGKITFRGTRPPIDSLLSLRVVALYRKYPLDSLTQAFSDQALAIDDTLPRFVDSANYVFDSTMNSIKVHLYAYIVVAQQIASLPLPFGNWRAIGVYAPSGNDSIPGEVNVIRDSMISRINIIVDYDHLPPP